MLFKVIKLHGRRRAVDPALGTNLDLSYITENLIAMGVPVSRFPKTLYYNRISDLCTAKGGKGRTGVVCSTYMLLTGVYENSQTCLENYTLLRMNKGWGNGVSGPGQIKWVHYFQEYLKLVTCGKAFPLLDYNLVKKLNSGYYLVAAAYRGETGDKPRQKLRCP
ncbi:hypothetical protein BDR26DRAFT_1007302 [Obelidium mucronatum]|nr:hypothetical protein BDR26DRAFT_1007302 [Obelidium mucronatum]